MKKLWIFVGILALFFLIMSDNAFSKSAKNKAECEKWCNANKPRCAFCDSDAFCEGRTYDVIKSFKKGTGNWYACGLSEYGRETLKNKNDCLQWCRQHEQDKVDPCVQCSTAVGCGSGYKVIKRFQGEGKNWNACTFISSRGACEEFCKKSPECEFCSGNAGCGAGYTSMKTFHGGILGEYFESTSKMPLYPIKGKNSYACKKK